MLNNKEKWHGRLAKAPYHRFKVFSPLGVRSIQYGHWYISTEVCHRRPSVLNQMDRPSFQI